MTYMEKVLSAVRFDDELMSRYESDWLKDEICGVIRMRMCPGSFHKLFGAGAPIRRSMDTCPVITGKGNCAWCWEQEAE